MSRQPTPRTSINREKPILLGFATQKKGIDGRLEFSIRWGRLIGTAFFLIIAGWFCMAGALYFHFKYNKEYDEVSYTRMLTLLPFGIEEHRLEMGNYHIEKGLAELQEGNYREALKLLRLGVGRAPANLDGRIALASFYDVALKRQDIAANLLIKGLNFGGIDDNDYLKDTLRLLLKHQLDDEVQKIADRYLPEEPEITDQYQMIAFGAASANYLRGNYDRADDYLIDYKLLEAQEGALISARISWDRGNKIAAITKLEHTLKKHPNAEAILMELTRYHTDLGQIDAARRYAILRNVSDPLSAAPRIDLLHIYNKSGDTEREQRETQRLLKQFRDVETALQSLANFAAATGNIDLARRTYEEALENEFAIGPFALLLIEAHLVDQDFEGALAFSEELLKERPDWLTPSWATFNSLRAVASYGINRPDLGEIYLQDFIDETTHQANTYLAVASRFTNIGRHQQTRTVLMAAYQKLPTNQKVLSELIRADLKLGNTENLNNLLSRLLQMRRPQIELLAEAYHKLGSDRFIFTPDRESLLLQLSAILRENSKALPEFEG